MTPHRRPRPLPLPTYSLALVAFLMIAAGCTPNEGGQPTHRSVSVQDALPELVNDAARAVAQNLRGQIPSGAPAETLLAIRSPRPGEPVSANANPARGAEARRLLAVALARELAGVCTVTSVGPDEDRSQLITPSQAAAVSITGEIDPSADPKTYRPDRVYVLRAAVTERPSGAKGVRYGLETAVWSPQRGSAAAMPVVEHLYYRVDGGWMRTE